MAILQVNQLSKDYGSGDSLVRAVDKLCLTVHKGESLAITGASGSGKSTLMHIMGGLEQPTDGEVTVSGNNIYAFSENERTIFRRRKLGFVFQSFNLVPVLNVEENIKIPVLLDKREVDSEWFHTICGRLGINERLSHFPAELSGGQQQRVAIARALIHKPEIIFADEPTGNLDTKNGRQALNLLFDLQKDISGTIIIVTHDLNVAKCCERQIFISDGRIVSL